ncbi:MAG: response regulator [Eubacterium sp.]|nr:response regulator [Eubacterium sp.]
MRLNVLVTGRNWRIVGDISEHLEADRGYITVKCRPNQNDLMEVILAQMPRVIVICMQDETVNSIKEFDILREYVRSQVAVFIITNDEDKKLFVKHTSLSKVYFLSRPVSLFALYEKLIGVEKELEESSDQPASIVEEFINPNGASGIRRKHVLVVDDDTEQLIQIKNLLSEFYDTTVVKSGEAAFKFLDKKKTDLILLDFIMPGMDGPEFLQMMRSMDGLADIPVVFLTGMTEKETVIKTLTELKPQGYVIKPSKKSEIVARIIDAMELAEEQAEERRNNPMDDEASREVDAILDDVKKLMKH